MNNEAPRCPHCNVRRFIRDDYDTALEGMSHLCWKCVKPIYEKGDREAESYWHSPAPSNS